MTGIGRRNVRSVGAGTIALVAVLGAGSALADVEKLGAGAFSFEMEVLVKGTPEEAFEAFTARTIEWWDHHFSRKPEALYFETEPGGGFLEIFDDAGNGARHATVIYVERGKSIRFTGPLGFSGHALQMVHSIDFEVAEGGTLVKLRLHGSGELQDGWPETVESVWRHFLVERFQPYMAGTLETGASGDGEPGHGLSSR